MYRSQLVDVQRRQALPTDGNSYTYEPMPADLVPPIGPNLLLHLFEHPEDAEPTSVLYRKIPKKLREKLKACPIQGSSIGWGLQLMEGVDWFVVFVYGCVGFLLALIFAIGWTVVQGDLQGAFAVAGYMVTFLLFCVGFASSVAHA